LLKGLLHNFHVSEESAGAILRALDKIEKEDALKIQQDLTQEGLSPGDAKKLYDLVAIKKDTKETFEALKKFGQDNELVQRGLDELRSVVTAMRDFGVPDSAFAVDLGVVRGLDYYTGTVYETQLVNHPDLGSICSGGRYDDLASYFTNTRLPGVGISIGLTRLFSKLREIDLLRPVPRTPAEAIVITMDHRYLSRYIEIARDLRAAGINTEVYLEPAKLAKQMAYADKKRFQVALIAGENEFQNNSVQIKNLAAQQATTVPISEVVQAVRNVLTRSSSAESH
jgi:histidyl-tRNA synthetase